MTPFECVFAGSRRRSGRVGARPDRACGRSEHGVPGRTANIDGVDVRTGAGAWTSRRGDIRHTPRHQRKPHPRTLRKDRSTIWNSVSTQSHGPVTPRVGPVAALKCFGDGGGKVRRRSTWLSCRKNGPVDAFARAIVSTTQTRRRSRQRIACGRICFRALLSAPSPDGWSRISANFRALSPLSKCGADADWGR